MWRKFAHSISPAKHNKKRGKNTCTTEKTKTTDEEHTVDVKSTEEEPSTEEKKTCRASKTQIDVEASQLLKKSWFHGLLPRTEVEELLENNGDFLVRKTELRMKERLAVSFKWKGIARHSVLELTPSQKWYLSSEKSFGSIESLIDYYLTSKAEFKKDGSKLLKPIDRPDWCLLHEHIKLGKKVGSGSFGDVFLAELALDDKKIEVAVKTLRGKMGKKERSSFVKEASLNRRLNHPNIVRLIGIASQCVPLMVVLELANGGSLKKHVKENVLLSPAQLTKYLLDAAKGLKYLSELSIIHRDVAARNCLLDSNMTVKISDFGLSIATKELKETKLSKVPIRWLAPETLRLGSFSSKTDVWSYGIMMWEVYSRCLSDPYPGSTNAESKVAIMSGNLMSVPLETPSYAAEIMKSCWLKDPESRPTFNDIVCRLSQSSSSPE